MAMILKAWETRQAMKKLARAKENARREMMGLPPIRPWYENCWIGFKEKLHRACVQTFCPCTVYDPNRHLVKKKPTTFCGRLWCDGTYENQVLKSFFGFIGGILLSLLWFVLMVFYMKYSPRTALITCSLLSLLLTQGLAFSQTVRCLTLLTLPQLCSSKGRAVLIAVCFVLVLNGPMQNFRQNVHVMSATVSCGQQMAGNITKDVVDAAMAPVKDVLSNIREALKTLTKLAEKLRDAVLKIRDLFVEVVSAVKRVFSWLDDMLNMCNDKMGAPYQRCMNTLHGAIHDCRRKLGILAFACNIVKGFTFVCEVTRVGEVLCEIPASVKKQIVGEVTKGLNFVLKDVYDMFYFNVTLHYHYDVTLEQTKSFQQVREDIQDEIEDRLRPLLNISSLSNVGLVVMMATLFLKAWMYRRKYLTKDRHDNFYITWHVRDIETKREEDEKETILPLNWKESSRYITTATPLLAKHERRKLIIGLVFLTASGLHIGFQLTCDYALYWLLDMIREHAELRTQAQAPGHVKMHVQGEGVLADIYRAMITQFDPEEGIQTSIDTTPCLPNPSPPDYDTYIRIGYIYATCILLVFIQSYCLRLRHVVAACYYPEREKVRAVWLYNHILKRRGNFLKFLRRKLRLQTPEEEAEEPVGLFEMLAAKSPLMGKLLRALGLTNVVHCLCCGASTKPGSKQDDFKRCDNRGCKAVYCQDCFTDINNMCTVCMSPVDYGDFSDFSEERDSSDEEEARRRARRLEEGRQRRKRRSRTSSSSSSYSEDDLDYSYQEHKDLDQLPPSDADTKDKIMKGLSATSPRPSKHKAIDTVSIHIFSQPDNHISISKDEEMLSQEAAIPEGVEQAVDVAETEPLEDPAEEPLLRE